MLEAVRGAELQERPEVQFGQNSRAVLMFGKVRHDVFGCRGVVAGRVASATAGL
jgi:hypothetical protein